MAEPLGRPGFDRLDFPGGGMEALRKLGYVWCGVYLAPAPCRPRSLWMTRVPGLLADGWGLAPIYLGQQLPGLGSSNILTAAQGRVDAVDATRLGERAKLEHGRVVFLDVEAGAGSLTAPARAYIKAWVSAMHKASSYRPGIYCSFKTNAAVLHQDNPDAVFWVWNLGHVDDPLPGGKPVRLHPSRSGVAFATAWQLFQSEIHEKGWTLTLDINGQRQKLQHWDFDTATSPDPSQPGADVPPWPGHGVVHPGASNDFVKLMQRKLIARGFAIPAGPTGFYGPQTKDAVTRYQQPRPRLHPADGVVGPRTWDQLFRGR